MKLLDRYLLREMVAPFIAGTLVFLAVVLAKTIVDSTEVIFQLRTPWLVTVQWLALRVPMMLAVALPVGAMLAVSLLVIRLGRDNELTALRMGGVSVRRVFLPLYAAGLAISVLSWLNTELVTPKASARADEVVLGTILQGGIQGVKSNATFRAEGDSFCHVSRVDLEREEMQFVLIYRLRDGRPHEALCAQRAVREDQQWYLLNGQHHTFDDHGRLVTLERFERFPVAFAEDITAIWDQDKPPEQLSAAELAARVRLLRVTGDVTNEQRLRYYLHIKFSYPLTCLIFTLLAAPLSFRVARPSVHPFAGVLVTIIVVFFCNGTINWARTIALSGPQAWIAPGPAAWLHVVIFGGLGAVLTWRAER